MTKIEESAALREALAKVRDRFFPADQPESARDLLWDEVNAALAATAPRDGLSDAKGRDEAMAQAGATALEFGYYCENMPPKGHWLMSFWERGRDLAKATRLPPSAPTEEASPATAPEPYKKPPLEALLDYADLADDHSYGTLSAKLVRDLVNEALATPSPTGATVPGVLADERSQAFLDWWHDYGRYIGIEDVVERAYEAGRAAPPSAHREQA